MVHCVAVQQCLSLVACSGPCPVPDRIVTASVPSTTLEDLLPAAKYRVTVEAAENHKEETVFTTELLRESCLPHFQVYSDDALQPIHTVF